MMTSMGKPRLSQFSLVSQVVGAGGSGEDGSGEGVAVAKRTGSHCGRQEKVRQYSLVDQVLEPAELTTFVNLLATLCFGTFGLLLLVVNS